MTKQFVCQGTIDACLNCPLDDCRRDVRAKGNNAVTITLRVKDRGERSAYQHEYYLKNRERLRERARQRYAERVKK